MSILARKVHRTIYYRLDLSSRGDSPMIVIEFLSAIIPGIILSILSGTIGRFVFNRFAIAQKQSICLVPLQTGLGFVIVMVLFNFLLVFQLISLTIVSSIIILLFILLWKDCSLLIKDSLRRANDSFVWVRERRTRLIFFFVLIITFFLGFVGLLAPSTGYDSTVYHLVLPKLYALEGGFVPRPDILQSRFAQNLAGIQTFSYQCGGEGAVEFLNMTACILLIWLLVESALIINVSKQWAAWSIVIVCGAFQFIHYLYDADVEGWLAFLTLCMFACVWLIYKQPSPTFLLFLGTFGGCLIGIKLTASPAVFLAVLFGLIKLCRLQRRILWGAGLGTSLLVLAIGSFWYIIIFQIYGHLYGDDILGEGDSFLYLNRLHKGSLLASLKSVVSNNLSFLAYITLVPLCVKDKIGREILVVLVFTWLAILITNPWGGVFARYIFFILPLVALGILLAFTQIDLSKFRGWNWARFVTIGLLSVSLIVTLAANTYRNSRKALVAFHLQDVDEYLAARVNTYRTIQKANDIVPPNGRLFMVGERNYWLDIPYMLGIARNPAITYNNMTPDSFFELLGGLGITHLLFSDEQIDYTVEFLKFWRTYPELKDDQRLMLLYHDVWENSKSNRNAYLYQIITPAPDKSKQKEEING